MFYCAACPNSAIGQNLINAIGSEQFASIGIFCPDDLTGLKFVPVYPPLALFLKIRQAPLQAIYTAIEPIELLLVIAFNALCK
jgi:hypothetical protein